MMTQSNSSPHENRVAVDERTPCGSSPDSVVANRAAISGPEALRLLLCATEVLRPLDDSAGQWIDVAAAGCHLAGREDVGEVFDRLRRWFDAANAFTSAGDTFASSVGSLPGRLADVDVLLASVVGHGCRR